MKHLAALLVLLGVGATAGILAADRDTAKPKPDPLTMALSASFAPEPAQVAVRMRIEPDPRIRSLSVEWWTEDLVGGSHVISLAGDRSATRVEYPIKGIEAGEDVVSAVLVRDDGSQVTRRARLVVVGSRLRPTFD